MFVWCVFCGIMCDVCMWCDVCVLGVNFSVFNCSGCGCLCDE